MDSGIYGPITRSADSVGHWAAIAIGFSIPISVALDNVLLALVLAGWLTGRDYKDKWSTIRRNPVAILALVLFGLLALGMLYGERYPGDGISYLVKYGDLLALPVLVYFFRAVPARGNALLALAISLGLVLVLSYLVYAGIVPQRGPILSGDPTSPVVFKYRLTHSFLMAYAAFLFTNLGLNASTRWVRLAWTGLAALAVVNVVLLAEGRTGYLVLAVLALYCGYAWRGWKGLGYAIAGTAALFTLLLALPGPVQVRMAEGWQELGQWRPGQSNPNASLEVRLDFYYTGLRIFRDNPLLGVGTGGFPKAYAEYSGGAKSRNPHNEFIHIGTQLGLAGLAAFLALLYAQWRLAGRLATPMETHLARGLVLAMAAGCMFNSLLLDHTEGLLYAWLSAVLYGGLKSTGFATQGAAS
jgi:O-antigen ligase